MSTPFEPQPFGSSVTSDADTTGAFLPLIILALTMLAWFGFQVVQLRVERDAMREALAKQDKPLEDSRKLRGALDSLARGTQQLADNGNPNARLVVDELKKRGVTFNTNAPAGTAPAAPAK